MSGYQVSRLYNTTGGRNRPLIDTCYTIGFIILRETDSNGTSSWNFRPMLIKFDWDLGKDERNQRKHGVRFSLAASVLSDPLALTRYDDEHSGSEDRWVTLGEVNCWLLSILGKRRKQAFKFG